MTVPRGRLPREGGEVQGLGVGDPPPHLPQSSPPTVVVSCPHPTPLMARPLTTDPVGCPTLLLRPLFSLFLSLCLAFVCVTVSPCLCVFLCVSLSLLGVSLSVSLFLCLPLPNRPFSHPLLPFSSPLLSSPTSPSLSLLLYLHLSVLAPRPIFPICAVLCRFSSALIGPNPCNYSLVVGPAL